MHLVALPVAALFLAGIAFLGIRGAESSSDRLDIVGVGVTVSDPTKVRSPLVFSVSYKSNEGDRESRSSVIESIEFVDSGSVVACSPVSHRVGAGYYESSCLMVGPFPRIKSLGYRLLDKNKHLLHSGVVKLSDPRKPKLVFLDDSQDGSLPTMLSARSLYIFDSCELYGDADDDPVATFEGYQVPNPLLNIESLSLKKETSVYARCYSANGFVDSDPVSLPEALTR